jgi:hypothetical protein
VERLLEGVQGRTRWYQRCWHERTVTQSSATHMVTMYLGEVEVSSFAGRPALEQGLVYRRRRGGRRGVGEVELDDAVTRQGRVAIWGRR